MKRKFNEEYKFVYGGNDKERGFGRLWEGFLTKEEADDLFEKLENCGKFHKEKIKILGKEIETPRLVTSFGEKNTTFVYSGRSETVGDEGWSFLENVKNKIEEVTGQTVNYVHTNEYRNGNDYIGWHADKTKTLEDGSMIISLSVGAERKFQLKKKEKGAKIEIDQVLKHGSLLTMEGNTQKYWKHRVPKDKNLQKKRFNLTFRLVKVN